MLGHLNLGEGNMFDRNDTKDSLKDLPKDNHEELLDFLGRPLTLLLFLLQLSTKLSLDRRNTVTVGW